MAIQAQFYPEFSFGVSQDFVMENAAGFDHFSCLIPPQPQQQFLPLDQFQNHKNVNNLPSMPLSQTVFAHLEKQTLEFEQFINLENERLRLAMQEERKRQTVVLIKKFESRSRVLLRQKDEEIMKTANRRNELENFLKRIEIESQTWQKVAKQNEAMVASLNGTIQRLRESSRNAAEDAESCCQNIEEEESQQGQNGNFMCKCCNSRTCCMVILPCRHLCSCKDCEVFLDSCPVCKLPKKASIEALF